MDNIFRRFFGFPNFREDFDNTFPTFESPDDDDDFENPNHLPMDPGDIFKHFEKQFEEMFKNFGFMEFNMPMQIDITPPPAQQDQESGSLRDKMLKPKQPESNAIIPQERMTPFFRGFWQPNEPFIPSFESLPKGRHADTDIDSKIENEGIDTIIGRNDASRQPSNSRSFFSGTFHSVTKIQGADGKIEEHRRTRDSSGNEQSVVIRQIGDKMHSVTTRHSGDGTEERQEDFYNLEENKIKEFDEKWNSDNSSSRTPTIAPYENNDPLSRRMYEKFFKNWMPRNDDQK